MWDRSCWTCPTFYVIVVVELLQNFMKRVGSDAEKVPFECEHWGGFPL